MILMNMEFVLIQTELLKRVSCMFEGSGCSEAWKMGAKLRGLCTEIIAEFLVHGKPFLAMKVSSYHYIRRRELWASDGFQREILAPRPAWLKVM